METTNYITSEIASQIDKDLMSKDLGYSIDQLMEIAGLSVAQAISESQLTSSKKKMLCIVGPGNNGGDGLVASRYLKEYGYDIDIYIPKEPKNDLYKRLIWQCVKYNIKFVKDDVLNILQEYDLIIDAIFGFSFKGKIRAPYDNIINKMKDNKITICSIDIPSGWDVEKGNINNTFIPEMNISLTLPKECMKNFKGEHYLGGRFIPKMIFEKYKIKQIPKYTKNEMILNLNKV